MRKGYYIHFQGRSSVGISKKIDMQLEEFSEHYTMEEVEIETLHRTLIQRIIGLFPTASISRNYKKAFDDLENPDFIYVRRAVADRKYVKFWCDIKGKYPECKIIIEIYTYPYDKDSFGTWDAWPFYIKELIYRGKLKRYIDRFVTYSKYREIFGVPTICTTNGVDIKKISLVKGEYQDNKLTMIGVAYMQRHHGYERLIEGMYRYYQDKGKKYEVKLLLVGEGPEKIKYYNMVQKYRLQSHVEFYSNTFGKQLDELYDASNIALASFGMYKLGIYDSLVALKTREYLAKGMPIITGCKIDILDDDFKYVKNFPNNGQAIEIEEIIKFYEKIKREDSNKETVAKNIRDFAVQHVDMKSVMKPIIEYIEDES